MLLVAGFTSGGWFAARHVESLAQRAAAAAPPSGVALLAAVVGLANAMVLAVVGALGGLAAAVRAARIQPSEALRQ